jgi:hypothetical protein
MKTKINNQKGMALVTVIVLLMLLSLIGTTALFSSNTGKKISANYRYAADALQNADAGISDAARQLANNTIVGNGNTNWSYTHSTTGFTNNYTVTYVLREDNGGNRTIAKDSANRPYYQIDSIGFSSGAAGVQRKIRAMVKMSGSGGATTFDTGVFGDDGVVLKGQGYIDSYDSSKSPWATPGQYKNGSIATNAKGVGVINLVGQGKVYGDARVGVEGNPATDITISGQGDITGAKDKISEKKDMTPKNAPPGGVPLTLSGTMTIPGGTYRVGSVNLTGQNVVTIGGNVTLIVDSTFKTAGQSKLLINEGASLTMYVAGNIDMAGQGIVNQNQKPDKVLVYGTETCTDVKLAGQSVLYAAMYTPKAIATFTGQADIFGSVVTKKITVTGQGSIHYDESLKNQGGGGGGGTITGYKMLSWKEL